MMANRFDPDMFVQNEDVGTRVCVIRHGEKRRLVETTW